jgi:hypothetical protein
VTARPFDCCYCGKPADDHFREVNGWEVRRSGGGANQIVGRTETGRYACSVCIRQIKDGITPGSPGLF